MKPARKNFGATNNTPWLAEVTVAYPDGTPFDLSGFDSFVMHVKQDPYIPEPEAVPTVTYISGALRISAPVEDIEMLDGAYLYEIIGIIDGEPHTKILQGGISVSQGIVI